jgi:hypothetical protein
MDEILIELVCKCEELYDISNKKYSDSVWKEELWGQMGEELKKSSKFQIVSEVELTEILQETKSTHSSEYSSSSPDEPGINETAFVMQILLQPGRQNLCN